MCQTEARFYVIGIRAEPQGILRRVRRQPLYILVKTSHQLGGVKIVKSVAEFGGKEFNIAHLPPPDGHLVVVLFSRYGSHWELHTDSPVQVEETN
jgi:hypothetical protein